MKIKLLLTIAVLCLVAVTASAQKATVKSFTQTTDHIPGNDRRNDLNGIPCALVKVQVVDNIERIEGNVIGDVVNRGVEKWVYMCKGSRNMRIHLKHFLPVMVMFRDYQVNGLESNRVYELVIEVPKTAGGNAPITDIKGNNLQMRVSPSNATLTIWGDDMVRQAYRPQDDGMLSVYLPYGRYHYQATANGYEPLEGTVFVNDESSVHYVDMSAIMGTLTINCLTEKAEFYLNNEVLMKSEKATSWSGQVVPGRYVVKVSRKGYLPQTKTIDVVARETTSLQFDHLLSEAEQKKMEREKEKIEEEARAKALADSLDKQRAKLKEEEERVKAKKALEEAAQKKQKAEATAKKMEELDKKPIFWGITAGYNMATAGLSSDNDGSTKSVGGFHVGLTADVRVANNFYLNTGLIYSAKGYKYDSRTVKEKANPQFIDIPILAAIRIPVATTVKIQFNAGPYLAMCVGGKVTDEINNYYDESFSSAYSGFDYGVQAGAGIIVSQAFYIGGGYQIGLGSDYKNQNLYVGIGYKF